MDTPGSKIVAPRLEKSISSLDELTHRCSRLQKGLSKRLFNIM
jgi:hypothetical protein